MSNIYYSPEEFGLTTVGTVQWDAPSYDFNLTVVWIKDGTFYWASDSGCSCPAPFEDITFDELNRGTQHDAIDYLTSRQTEEEQLPFGLARVEHYAAAQIVELIAAILRAAASYPHVIMEEAA